MGREDLVTLFVYKLKALPSPIYSSSPRWQSNTIPVDPQIMLLHELHHTSQLALAVILFVRLGGHTFRARSHSPCHSPLHLLKLLLPECEVAEEKLELLCAGCCNAQAIRVMHESEWIVSSGKRCDEVHDHNGLLASLE